MEDHSCCAKDDSCVNCERHYVDHYMTSAVQVTTVDFCQDGDYCCVYCEQIYQCVSCLSMLSAWVLLFMR